MPTSNTPAEYVPANSVQAMHYQTLYQAVSDLASLSKASTDVKVLSESCLSWLAEELEIEEDEVDKEKTYAFKAHHFDRLFHTHQLMINAVRIKEAWSAIQQAALLTPGQ